MAGRLLVSCLRPNVQVTTRRLAGWTFPDKIGNRDIVGYGFNGEASYIDRSDFPMPAIRFKPNSSDVMALREKEKGDWKKLSIDEKKELYRASFRQTLTEIDAPTGEWKGNIGVAFMGVALALWVYMYFRVFVYPPLPESFKEENQLAELDRMLKLQMNPITGISSKYSPYTKST